MDAAQPANAPRPETTLAILLGARAWPDFAALEPSETFATSASRFKRYLLDPQGLALPAENALDLFDDPRSPAEVIKQIALFLETRRGALRQRETPPRDLLLYFVGHGAFLGEEQAYHLLLRFSHGVYQQATSLSIAHLAEVIRENARDLRKYFFIDACYAAGAAQGAWQSPDGVEIRRQTLQAFPPKGVALLCSSSRRLRSKAPAGEDCTMFTGAVLEVLARSDADSPSPMSLRRLGELARDHLLEKYGSAAVRPEVHSPDQRDGDIADVPVFARMATGADRPDKRADEMPRALLAKPRPAASATRRNRPSVLTVVAVLLSLLALGTPALLEWVRDRVNESSQAWRDAARVFFATAPLAGSVAILGIAVAREWIRNVHQFLIATAICILTTSVAANQFGLAGSVEGLDDLRAAHPDVPWRYGVLSVILAFTCHYWSSYGWLGFLSSIAVGLTLAWVWGVRRSKKATSP